MLVLHCTPVHPIAPGKGEGRGSLFRHVCHARCLRSQGLADLEDHKKKEAERLREASQEAYCGAAGYDVSSVQAAVLEGLKKEQQARKKGKTGPLELHLVGGFAHLSIHCVAIQRRINPSPVTHSSRPHWWPFLTQTPPCGIPAAG